MDTFAGGTIGSTGKSMSSDTAKLLETMCKGSKVSERTKRELKKAMETGGSLPSRVQNYKASKGPSQSSNFLGTKTWRGGKRVYTERERELLFESYRVKSYGGYSRDREAEKKQLQYKMEFFGRTPEQVLGISSKSGAGMKAGPGGVSRPPPALSKKADEKEDRFSELVQEVEEREEFIKLMEKAGKAQEIATVKAQISEVCQLCEELSVWANGISLLAAACMGNEET